MYAEFFNHVFILQSPLLIHLPLILFLNGNSDLVVLLLDHVQEMALTCIHHVPSARACDLLLFLIALSFELKPTDAVLHRHQLKFFFSPLVVLVEHFETLSMHSSLAYLVILYHEGLGGARLRACRQLSISRFIVHCCCIHDARLSLWVNAVSQAVRATIRLGLCNFIIGLWG